MYLSTNKAPLTCKYHTRLIIAMALEQRGYNDAKTRYIEHLKNFSVDELADVERTFAKIGTLHGLGVARFARELARAKGGQGVCQSA
ncbi:hypothetical protein TcarDRAFT_1304 [Thermosinus carboxydivorans Nor1]|uniref:Uncharacterized protein n=1 Tax=Thermosinus carboxydivorans Nor1 TaxID=401526 RepID=A1HR34_9FIRM|nr:hypothetical protein [Thermosinus carboxydivorans]EAX47569.1 hypothetical protein TcarDRAFT_1304 [Thermosinus carboxydivorans Nor1]